MSATAKGLRVGALIGSSLTAVILLLTAIKAATGSGWEIVGWTGIVTYLAAFPLSLLFGNTSGLWIYALVLLAPTINWAVLGLAAGWILSLGGGNTSKIGG